MQTAQYCAQKRNDYWQHERAAAGDTGIKIASGVTPYPLKSDNISDKANSDSGGNFGRLARCGLMDDYIDTMRGTLIRGIAVNDWLTFFKDHSL